MEDVSGLPDSVAHTIQHLLLVQGKMKTLEAARRSTIEVLMDMIPKESWTLDEAAHFMELLRKHGVKYRLELLSATGWSDQEIKYQLVFRQAKANPRRMKIPNGVHCVYVLMQHGVVVYIGRSRNLNARLSSHRASGNKFDDWEVYPCRSADEAADLEAVLQQQHRPIRNKRTERRRAS